MLQQRETTFTESLGEENNSSYRLGTVLKAKKVLRFHIPEAQDLTERREYQQIENKKPQTQKRNYLSLLDNLPESYKLFVSYKKSFKNGNRNFGFCELANDPMAFDRIVLALSSFFIDEVNIDKVLVIGDSFKESFFNKLGTFTKISDGLWSDGYINYVETSKENSVSISDITSETLVFSSFQQDENYRLDSFKLLQAVDSMTFIVDKDGSYKELQKAKSKFSNMNINLEGIIFDSGDSK